MCAIRWRIFEKLILCLACGYSCFTMWSGCIRRLYYARTEESVQCLPGYSIRAHLPKPTSARFIRRFIYIPRAMLIIVHCVFADLIGHFWSVVVIWLHGQGVKCCCGAVKLFLKNPYGFLYNCNEDLVIDLICSCSCSGGEYWGRTCSVHRTTLRFAVNSADISWCSLCTYMHEWTFRFKCDDSSKTNVVVLTLWNVVNRWYQLYIP